MKTTECKLCGQNLAIVGSLGCGGKIMNFTNEINKTGHTADCPASYSHIIDVDRYLAMSKKDYLEYLRKEIMDMVDSAKVDIENIDLLLDLEEK